MSELDIQRRKEYKQNRKKWIIIQLIAIALLAVIALSSFLVYNRMDRTYYVEYTEKGTIDYKVEYKENEFFDTEWVEENQTYISSLIEGMSADFAYLLDADSSDLGFGYQYQIDARMIVASKSSGAPYYTYSENLLPAKKISSREQSNVQIHETVLIDYVRYNEMAKSFIKTYNLDNAASCTLVVTLDVEILGSNKQSSEETRNRYSTSLNVPLVDESINIHTTSSSPDEEVKTFEYQSLANRDIFYTIAIVSLVLVGLLALGLIIFLNLTKNEDITYAAKINRILRSYSAYIQRMDGEFECEGYQVIMIKTFNEMLGIRDTIQSPILMYENHDETMTRFLIPTNTSLLYVFEIKVDNYDAIYGLGQEKEEKEEEDVEVVVLEDVDEELLAEAMAEPDIDITRMDISPEDDQIEAAPEEPGVEVIGVVWPEHEKRNKVYLYDPNGEELEKGDIVLVPTYDAARKRDVIRKVAVAHENHRVPLEFIKHPLKKIVAVVKRNIADSLTPKANHAEKKASDHVEAAQK